MDTKQTKNLVQLDKKQTRNVVQKSWLPCLYIVVQELGFTAENS